MTILASAVAIGDNQLVIDAPMADALPAFVKIDSEILNVGGAENRTGTTLTLSSPATATHNNSAWAFHTEEWNFSEPLAMYIEVAPNSDPGNTWRVTTYASADPHAIQGDATVSIEAASGDGSVAPFRNIALVVEASRLTFRTADVATAGESDIYALIAEPA